MITAACNLSIQIPHMLLINPIWLYNVIRSCNCEVRFLPQTPKNRFSSCLAFHVSTNCFLFILSNARANLTPGRPLENGSSCCRSLGNCWKNVDIDSIKCSRTNGTLRYAKFANVLMVTLSSARDNETGRQGRFLTSVEFFLDACHPGQLIFRLKISLLLSWPTLNDWGQPLFETSLFFLLHSKERQLFK